MPADGPGSVSVKHVQLKLGMIKDGDRNRYN